MFFRNRKKPYNFANFRIQIECKHCGRKVDLTEYQLRKIAAKIQEEENKDNRFFKFFIKRKMKPFRYKERGPGICVKCGEEIPLERLKTLPNTNLCVGCKRAEELLYETQRNKS